MTNYYEKLAQKKRLLTSDLLRFLDPTNPKDANLIDVARTTPQLAYDIMTEELWELDHRHEIELSAFREQLEQQRRYVWIKNILTGSVIKILPEPDYTRVLYSRLFPNVSSQELKLFQSSTAIIFGASTGDIIAKLLSQSGVKIVLIDPDEVSLSNLTRLFSSTLEDVGVAKVLRTGFSIVSTNPYADITLYPRALEETEIAELFTETQTQGPTVCIDAMDNLKQKVLIRRFAADAKIPVIMNTNLEYRAVVTIENPGDPMFLHPETSYSNIASTSIKKDVASSIKQVVEIIGTEHIPPRWMINLLLFVHGETEYLSQHGINAAAGGSVAAQLALKAFQNEAARPRVVVNLNKLVGSTLNDRIAADNKLLAELHQTYPKILGPYQETADDLHQTVTAMTKDVFDLEYKFEYLTSHPE